MIKALQSFTGRAARRLRGIRRRATSARKALRRAAVLGCLTASMLGASQLAWGQMGQAPMAASGGLANRAVQGLSGINLNGQGRLYYGINAADRGLGYRGSYMTLGGYFPTVEDDLGGLWAADVRSHLSNYGGFFSNVGAVRKQLLGGGSLLGVGVYWDYDGDQNQYADQLIGTIDPVLFPGGFSYNQVGVSGELLTDWGNLRSNGYIPLGSTGQSTGRFVSTNILCMQGINAALGGADLEVGAYLPGLADWSGMINVGGYTYGNTRYQIDSGAPLVPWFGGVYTRIDLTFAQNWDFSLQYNNDSYFDSTGFARLTYRLGGSRRRNVPDQMEQPMMRNEHIVRAHQDAEIALNPSTGSAWRVIHVDNTATAPGTGSVTSPLTSLDGPTGAETVANAQYDIIFVHQSGTAYSNIGGSPLFTFAESNQYLIGEGSAQTIPTLNCGPIIVSTTVAPSLYPILTPRANDTAVSITAARANETVSGFVINASGTGIDSQSPNGLNTYTDLTINGGLTGVAISGSADYTITDVILSSQTGVGLENTGSGAIQLSSTTLANIAGTAIETNNGVINASALSISDSAGTGVIVGGANQASFSLTDSTISNAQQSGIINDGDGSITVARTQITGSGQYGVRTTGASTGTVSLADSTIDGATASGGRSTAGVLIEGDTPVTLNRTSVTTAVTGVDVTGNGQLSMTAGSISDMTNDAIRLQPSAPATALDGSAALTSVTIGSIGGSGIVTQGVGGQGGNVSLINSSISTVGDYGILGVGIGSPGVGATISVQSQSLIANTGIAGIQVTDSNLRVENSTITSNGDFGINSIDASTVLLDSNSFTGETATAIQASARNDLSFTGGNPGPGAATGLFNDLTATNNRITTTADAIVLQGGIVTWDNAGQETIDTQGIVRANLRLNSITTDTNPITLSTTGGIAGASSSAPNIVGGLTVGLSGRPQGIQINAVNRTNLEALNGGVEVTEDPTAPDPESTTTSVDYSITTPVTQPPQ